MTRHVPISEFKDHASELIAAAEGGEEIVITRHGKPVAELHSARQTLQDREQVARDALATLAHLREAAAAKGQTAKAAEWIEWKKVGQR